MPHKIIISVAAKEQTMLDCVKLTPSKSYTDSIYRNTEYFGDSTVTVTFQNLCGKAFSVPSFALFSNNENGGSFSAKVDAFSISAGQEINIPVKYYGIFKGDALVKNYIVSFNGSTAAYTLNINDKKIQHPPVIQDVNIILENRENYTFKLSDFTSKFTDADGDSMDSILLEGDLSAFRLNGNPITSPALISAYDISVGALVYIAKDTDDEVNVVATLKAKDSTGLISQ